MPRRPSRNDPYHPYVAPWWLRWGPLVALLFFAGLIAALAVATR